MESIKGIIECEIYQGVSDRSYVKEAALVFFVYEKRGKNKGIGILSFCLYNRIKKEVSGGNSDVSNFDCDRHAERLCEWRAWD